MNKIENQKFTIQRLIPSDMKPLYKVMEKDFPPNELKPLKIIEDSFESGFMEGYGLYREGDAKELLAYALFVKLNQVLLFDYLAVLEAFRSEGIGSIFLQKLKEILKEYECVIGEVENPDYCQIPDEKVLMERRIQFYIRNGIRDTGASCRVYGVEYRLFEIEGERKHSPEEAAERISRFYHVYWPDESDYAKYVQMHDCF